MSQKTQRSFCGEVPPRPVDLLAHEGRHDRQRNQLRMRMLERRASRPAVVLEQQDVAQAAVLPEVAHALAERRQHPLDLGLGHRRQRLDVIGRLDDDFVRADPVHAIEHPLAFAVEPALDLQRRKLVGHDAQFPAGTVARRRSADRRTLPAASGPRAPAQNGQYPSRATWWRSNRKSLGRLRRSVEMTTQRPVTGSFRSSGIWQFRTAD